MLTCVAAALVASTAAVAQVPDLAQEVQAQAHGISTATRVTPQLLASLDDFAVDAMALSDAIREAQGPQDLACIFRGISQDTQHQRAELAAARDLETQSRLLVGLRTLMGDAALFAPMASRELQLAQAE